MPDHSTIHRPRAAWRQPSRLAGMVAGLLLSAMVLTAAPAQAAEPVGLGIANSFAVLAATGITNTGGTTITGDIGSFADPAVDADEITLTGASANHGGDLVTAGAKLSLITAYNDAAGRTPATDHAVELASDTPLLPGIYSGGTFGLTGTLTLDAQGDPDATFVFQVASTLITEVNSRVLLVNGADPCNVVWQVGSSATFKSGTQFVGDVLALTSIDADNGATFRGRLLAWNGTVTLDTNIITNATCATAGGGTDGTDGTDTDGTDGTDGTTGGGGGTDETTGGTDGATDGTDGGAAGTTGGTDGATDGSDTVRQLVPSGPRSPGGPLAPPTGTPATPGRPDLPRTGTDNLELVAAGLALLTFGAVLLSSRKPQEVTRG